MGTGGPFPGVKRGQAVMLTTHSHPVPRSTMNRSYTPPPLGTCMAYQDSFTSKSYWVRLIFVCTCRF